MQRGSRNWCTPSWDLLAVRPGAKHFASGIFNMRHSDSQLSPPQEGLNIPLG